MRVNEVYPRVTVQGEGPHVGRVCTFVRLYGCNLHCRWCDTPYTWDVDGRNGVAYPRAENVTDWTVDAVVEHVVGLNVPLVIVSGGEPLLQATELVQLAAALRDVGVETHVETNGTRPPPAPVAGDPISHYSVSPKLPSAEAGRNALLVDVMAMWAQHPRAIFKIVCSDPDEVRQACALFDLCQVRPEARWIMPEGRSQDDVESSLGRIVDAVIEHRANLSTRLHVLLWGTERGR